MFITVNLEEAKALRDVLSNDIFKIEEALKEKTDLDSKIREIVQESLAMRQKLHLYIDMKIKAEK